MPRWVTLKVMLVSGQSLFGVLRLKEGGGSSYAYGIRRRTDRESRGL